MAQQILDRIRSHLASTGLSRSGLARAAGLHANTLRDLDEPGWNPTAETLRKLEAFLSGSGPSPLVPIEEIIAEARNGRMYVLVDDEDRENEGDLIIPAQMATPDAINFMATHGRGLICLALTPERAGQLGLSLVNPGTARQTGRPFARSIEAAEGVSTGISAADRAHTVQVAIAEGATSAHIHSPGHVFPLIARAGGVLERASACEASIDLARLSGAGDAAVICSIMRDDGEMARLEDIGDLIAAHGLAIADIGALIERMEGAAA